jgi:hypothetical protein
VERRPDTQRLEHHDPVGQGGVEGAAERVRLEGGAGREAHHLIERVDPRVGPRRHG